MKLNLPNKLNTKRLSLRPFREEDLDDLHLLLNDDEVIKGSKTCAENNTISKVKDLLRHIISSYNSHDPIFALAITQKSSEIFLGTCGLNLTTETASEPECFYALLSAFRGNGYMIEGLKKVLEYVFEELNLTYIELYLNPKNPLGWKVAERVGFKYMGTITYKKDSSDALFFTIEKREYENQRNY